MSKYIILVTGSRDWGDYASVLEALFLYKDYPSVTVRHGDCSNIVDGEELSLDMLADRAAKQLGFDVDPMPADWDKYKKAAGPIRNMDMIKKEPKANICLAFGKLCARPNCTLVPGPHVSHGTRHCSLAAERAGIEVRKFRG